MLLIEDPNLFEIASIVRVYKIRVSRNACLGESTESYLSEFCQEEYRYGSTTGRRDTDFLHRDRSHIRDPAEQVFQQLGNCITPRADIVGRVTATSGNEATSLWQDQ